jgi:membrane-associated phospholipid phosphatase
MRKSAILLAFVVGLALLAGCSMTVDPNFQPQAAGAQSEMVEPEAGQWQTWVLESSDALRPAAPPDAAATQAELAEVQQAVAGLDEAALQQIAYWDAGAPNYRWLEIAFNQFKSKGANPQRTGRGIALLNVAIYDAIVAAWDAKAAYNRPRPSQVDPTLTPLVAVPNSPSYPSEHAVAAGAAAEILSYLFPDNAQTFAAQAEEAAHSRVLAGVQYPSDAEAGMALGRQVAEQVIERAMTDGSDAVWDGQMPTEEGHWTGENPNEPMMGTWTPWVLASGDELRPGPPFANDSPELAAELAEVQTFTRTWQSNQKALYWQAFEGGNMAFYDFANKRIFEHHLDTNPPYAAQIYATLATARLDSLIACWDAKYVYWAIRPYQLDPELVPLFPTPHPSYPSGHSCGSGASATVLESIFPAEAAAARALADEASESRIWAGIHYRNDMAVGGALGQAVAEKVLAHAGEMMQP